MAIKAFRARFAHLTANCYPFVWQEELFERILEGIFPETIDLPTGAGKTSVMVIWLLALAAQAERARSITIPRRLVWVVDRRIVVDQATEEADRLAKCLAPSANPDPVSEEVRHALASLSCPVAPEGSVLAVSTLRGEHEDNREWSEHPARPAIVIGTVDMIGSRLLFSGYGDSRRRRPLHAGLLGRDALIVNDEAHLTPAFAALVQTVAHQTSGMRPMRAVLLSATQRDQAGGFPGDLSQDLSEEQSAFTRRFRAVKRLHLVSCLDKPNDEIRKLALQPDRRTIVYVRSPKLARDIAVALGKQHGSERVALLTGEQRGRERDLLLYTPVFKRFLLNDSPPDSPPCWLIATSAGEVGINVSADRLITDLDTADHLIQRFGRLNRFGDAEGDAYVVYAPKQSKQQKRTEDNDEANRLKQTLEYLKKLNGSVSPEGLRNQPPPQEAMSKTPNLAPLLPWHVDVWSMTSINTADWPSRPAVDPWLHGDEPGSQPETYLAWRKDVADLQNASASDIEEVFGCYPVLAHERLKCYTDGLRDALHKADLGGHPAVLIAADGETRAATIGTLLEEPARFLYATLVLPPGVGYLDEFGMVDWSRPTDKLTDEEIKRYDVADIEGERLKVRVGAAEATPDVDLRLRCTVEIPAQDENEEPVLWKYFAGRAKVRAPHGSQLLTNHQARVASVAADLARQLGMGDRLLRIFEWAGGHHDLGKARPVWQRAAGNRDGGHALAKSDHFRGRALDGYRHELGSLLDSEKCLPPEFTSEERDLALHLIAAHHGWARPHFPSRAFDKSAYFRSEPAALECARRFGRLQRIHGPWRLAYLEAVFHSADAIASGDQTEPANA